MRNKETMRRVFAMMNHMAVAAGAAPDFTESQPVLTVALDSATPSELLDAFVSEYNQWWSQPWRPGSSPKDMRAGKAMLARKPDVQLAILHEALERAVATTTGTDLSQPHALVECAEMLLGRELPYGDDDLLSILRVVIDL